MQYSKKLSSILLGALLGAVLMTVLSPYVIQLLFTPPISFGTNCEPAVAWSMSKLVYAQIAGLILGPIGGYIVGRKFAKKTANPT